MDLYYHVNQLKANFFVKSLNVISNIGLNDINDEIVSNILYSNLCIYI